jgi:hypothetical protein
MRYILILIFSYLIFPCNAQIFSPAMHGLLNKSYSTPLFNNKGTSSYVSNGVVNYQIKILNNGGNSFLNSGICISTSPNPNINDRVIGTNINNNIISSNINSLTSGTKYYVKAFVSSARYGIIYSNEDFFTADYIIGREYLGGKIAYIFTPSDSGFIVGETHGIIAAINDARQPPYTPVPQIWGAVKYSFNSGEGIFKVDYITTGTTATKIGSGLLNTLKIIHLRDSSNWQFDAATFAYQPFSEGGITKYWFLPSLDELYKLYLNKDVIGGFYTDRQRATGHEPFYWTSSEVDEAYVEVLNFENGERGGSRGYKGAGGYGWVRAIRYF